MPDTWPGGGEEAADGGGGSVGGLCGVEVSRSETALPEANVASGVDAPDDFPSPDGGIVAPTPSGSDAIVCPQIGHRSDGPCGDNGDLQAGQWGMRDFGFLILDFRFRDRTSDLSHLTLLSMSHTGDFFNCPNITCLPAWRLPESAVCRAPRQCRPPRGRPATSLHESAATALRPRRGNKRGTGRVRVF